MSALARALIAELDDEALDALAAALAPRLAGRLEPKERHADGWLDSAGAASYLALSRNSLHKLTAAREVPFEQDCRRGKLWFRRADLDLWRTGEWKRGSASAA